MPGEVPMKVTPVSTAIAAIFAEAGRTQRAASGEGFQGPRFLWRLARRRRPSPPLGLVHLSYSPARGAALMEPRPAFKEPYPIYVWCSCAERTFGQVLPDRRS